MENKEKIRLYLVVGLLAVIAIWYLFSTRDVSDDGARIDNIRNELADVQRQQQSVNQRLGTIETGLAESEKRVEYITTTVENADGRIAESQARAISYNKSIRECQQIIREIRERGKK